MFVVYRCVLCVAVVLVVCCCGELLWLVVVVWWFVVVCCVFFAVCVCVVAVVDVVVVLSASQLRTVHMSARSYDDAAVHCVRIDEAMCCHKAVKTQHFN